MTWVGGPDEGVIPSVTTALMLKAAEATTELVPEYTITKSEAADAVVGTVIVVAEGIVPVALEVKLPVVPATHATEVALVLRQSL